MWRRAILCILPYLAIAWAAEQTHADGVLRDSAGAISSGRAGANLASADNGAIIASNPAAMSWVAGGALDEVRLDTYDNTFLFSQPDNPDVTSEQAPAVLPEFSIIREIPSSSITLGVAALFPGGFSTEYHFNDPVYGRQLNRSFAALVKLVPALSWRPYESFSVGATVGLAASQIKLRAPYVAQRGPLAGTPTLVDVNATGFAPTWSVGAFWHPLDGSTLGASYTSESSFTLNGRGRVQVGNEASRYDADVGIAWPRSVQAGARHELTRSSAVFLDFTWFNWGNAFDAVEFTFTEGGNADLPRRLADAFPLNFRDTYGFRLGGETAVGNDTFRVGYAFHTSAVRSAYATPLVPGTLESFVSAGYGHALGDWRVDAAVGYSWGARVDTGTSAFVGGRYNDSSLLTSSWVLFLSVTRSPRERDSM